MNEKKPVKYHSPEEALDKLQRYCAYQDRCHQEVRTKLLELGIYGEDLEQIIVELIRENFLNEERFARSYARGKFRIKRWGRIRIQLELKKRKISAYCIRKGLEEIDEEEYQKVLEEMLQKKIAASKLSNTFQRNSKAGQYAIGRGFESWLVWDTIRKLY